MGPHGNANKQAIANLLVMEDIEKQRHKKNPFEDGLVKFATSKFVNQCHPAGNGVPVHSLGASAGRGTGSDPGLARSAVESSADLLHARVELLRSMKASLSKQAAEAIKAVSASASEPADALKKSGAQQPHNAASAAPVPVRVAGAAAMEQLTDTDRGFAGTQVKTSLTEQLLQSATSALSVWQAVTDGSADVFPAAWISKQAGRPKLTSKQTSATHATLPHPELQRTVPAPANLDAFLEDAIQQCGMCGGMDINAWYGSDHDNAVLLGGIGASDMLVWESSSQEQDVDLDQVELPSYLRCYLQQQGNSAVDDEQGASQWPEGLNDMQEPKAFVPGHCSPSPQPAVPQPDLNVPSALHRIASDLPRIQGLDVISGSPRVAASGSQAAENSHSGQLNILPTQHGSEPCKDPQASPLALQQSRAAGTAQRTTTQQQHWSAALHDIGDSQEDQVALLMDDADDHDGTPPPALQVGRQVSESEQPHVEPASCAISPQQLMLAWAAADHTAGQAACVAQPKPLAPRFAKRLAKYALVQEAIQQAKVDVQIAGAAADSQRVNASPSMQSNDENNLPNPTAANQQTQVQKPTLNLPAVPRFGRPRGKPLQLQAATASISCAEQASAQPSQVATAAQLDQEDEIEDDLENVSVAHASLQPCSQVQQQQPMKAKPVLGRHRRRDSSHAISSLACIDTAAGNDDIVDLCDEQPSHPVLGMQKPVAGKPNFNQPVMMSGRTAGLHGSRSQVLTKTLAEAVGSAADANACQGTGVRIESHPADMAHSDVEASDDDVEIVEVGSRNRKQSNGTSEKTSVQAAAISCSWREPVIVPDLSASRLKRMSPDALMASLQKGSAAAAVESASGTQPDRPAQGGRAARKPAPRCKPVHNPELLLHKLQPFEISGLQSHAAAAAVGDSNTSPAAQLLELLLGSDIMSTLGPWPPVFSHPAVPAFTAENGGGGTSCIMTNNQPGMQLEATSLTSHMVCLGNSDSGAGQQMHGFYQGFDDDDCDDDFWDCVDKAVAVATSAATVKPAACAGSAVAAMPASSAHASAAGNVIGGGGTDCLPGAAITVDSNPEADELDYLDDAAFWEAAQQAAVAAIAGKQQQSLQQQAQHVQPLQPVSALQLLMQEQQGQEPKQQWQVGPAAQVTAWTAPQQPATSQQRPSEGIHQINDENILAGEPTEGELEVDVRIQQEEHHQSSHHPDHDVSAALCAFDSLLSHLGLPSDKPTQANPIQEHQCHASLRDRAAVGQLSKQTLALGHAEAASNTPHIGKHQVSHAHAFQAELQDVDLVEVVDMVEDGQEDQQAPQGRHQPVIDKDPWTFEYPEIQQGAFLGRFIQQEKHVPEYHQQAASWNQQPVSSFQAAGCSSEDEEVVCVVDHDDQPAQQVAPTAGPSFDRQHSMMELARPKAQRPAHKFNQVVEGGNSLVKQAISGMVTKEQERNSTEAIQGFPGTGGGSGHSGQIEGEILECSDEDALLMACYSDEEPCDSGGRQTTTQSLVEQTCTEDRSMRNAFQGLQDSACQDLTMIAEHQQEAQAGAAEEVDELMMQETMKLDIVTNKNISSQERNEDEEDDYAQLVDDSQELAQASYTCSDDGIDWEAGCEVLSEPELDEDYLEVDPEEGLADEVAGAAAMETADRGDNRCAELQLAATAVLRGGAVMAATKRGKTAKELLRSRLIEEVLRSHRRSRVDLKSIMSYLATTIAKTMQLQGRHPDQLQQDLQEPTLGLAGVAGKGHNPVAPGCEVQPSKRRKQTTAQKQQLEGEQSVASLQQLQAAALENKVMLFGDDIEVTPHRVFLALLNLAHQNNSAVAATATAAAGGAGSGSAAALGGAAAQLPAASGAKEAGGVKDVSMGRLWVPGLAWLRLKQVIMEQGMGTASTSTLNNNAADSGTAAAAAGTANGGELSSEAGVVMAGTGSVLPPDMSGAGEGYRGSSHWDIHVVLEQASGLMQQHVHHASVGGSPI